MPNSVSGSVPAIWSKYLAKTYDAASVFTPLCNRSVEGELAQEGDTVHVNKPGNVTVSDYSVGVDNSIQTVSLTDATLTLDQKKYFQFVIDKIEKSTSQHDLVKMFSDRGAIAMAQAMDDRVITHTADALTANKIGALATPVTLNKDNIYDYMVEAKLRLDNQNVPMDGRVFVVDPSTVSLILKCPELLRLNSEKSDTMIAKATIGDMAGFRIVVSNRYATASNTKTLMYFHKDFISLAVRISPDQMEIYKPEKQFGTGVKCLAFYGSKVFNSAAGGTLVKSA